MAAELLKGPDPAVIYQYSPDQVMIDYPELILRLLMVLPHLSGLSMLMEQPPHAVCLSQAIHLQLQKSTAQHSTAWSADRSYAYTRQTATQAGS
jgi:hypothetical protein